MEGVEIHSTSPINSDSSKDGQPQEPQKLTAPIRPSLATMHKTSWTSYMIREESEPSSSFSSSASGSGSGSGASSSARGDAIADIASTTNREDSTTNTTDTPIQDDPLASQSATENPTVQTREPANTTTTAASPSFQSMNPHRRSSTRIHTRNSSISATMDLPWKIDNTSSPSTYTPTSHKRNSSFGIPPPPKAGEMSRNSSHSSYSTDSTADSPKLHPLMTRVATSANLATSPSPYAHSSTHQAPSPYGSYSTSMSASTSRSTSAFNFDFPPQNQNQSSFSQQHSQPTPHSHSLSSPPGYTQNPTAHTPITHQPPLFISTTYNPNNTTSPSRRDSSSYSPHDTTAPLYTSDTSPLYQNTTSYSSNSNTYNTTLFSPSFSFAPKTPTPKKLARAGILDNDPNMYLTRDGDGEEDSIWDAATKWVRSTGMKMSLGGEVGGGVQGVKGGEYSIGSGLWKMVAGSGAAGAGAGAGAGGGGLSNAY